MNTFTWFYMVQYLSGDFHDETSAMVLAGSMATNSGEITGHRVVVKVKNEPNSLS